MFPLFLLGSSIAMFEFFIHEAKALDMLSYVGITLVNTFAPHFK